MNLDDILATLDAWLAQPHAPLLTAVVGFGALTVLTLLLLHRARKARLAAKMEMAAQLTALAEGQQRLAGALTQGLSQSGEASARAQTETLRLVETRLDEVTKRLTDNVAQTAERSAKALAEATKAMESRLAETQAAVGQSLSGSAERTAHSLGALTERLEAIDRAQTNIEKLSSDVLGLQDILANKQSRGRFGEIQLNDLIVDALPPSAYDFQATLSNGRRVDVLLKLPDPPGPVAVDAKFPLEAYEALREAETKTAAAEAERAFRQSVLAHVDAIAEKYVVPGETADGALLFLPSEAVYAELHARFPGVVRDSFAKRVWIVSPTTLMATLLTMRAILKDAKLRERSSDLRRAVGLLAQDVERLATRAEKLRGYFAQSERALREIGISADKALRRARDLAEGDATADDGEAIEIFADAAPPEAAGPPRERTVAVTDLTSAADSDATIKDITSSLHDLSDDYMDLIDASAINPKSTSKPSRKED